MKDLKITGGRIPDFDSGKFIEADILIHNGIIEKTGRVTEPARQVIDAAGKIVSPGFIDIHAHEDGPEDDFFASRCCLRMGVTTKVGGCCGEMKEGLDSFVKRLRNGSPTNYMMFIGQNTLRQMAGADDIYAPADRQQIEKMKDIITSWKALGPAGLSCGFEYAPGVSTKETLELLSAFEEKGYMACVHFREDGPGAADSAREMIKLSQESGFRMQMSHIGSCSAVGYMEETLKVLEDARAEGVDIMADCYPYNAFSTGIGTAVFDEGAFGKWKYEDILITEGPYKGQRCTEELFIKLRRENPEMFVVAFVMNEDEIQLAYSKPYVLVGSDTIFHNRAGHPRGAGTFPRVLGRYVREKGVMSLMVALEKMTRMPAERMNLKDRGQVKEGMIADLVIFDEKTVADRATFEEPALAPEGISHVVLKGEIAVSDGEIVNDRLGCYIPYRPLQNAK